MKAPLRILGLVLAICVVAPAAAAAATPPDNGAVNQYTETFPGPGGNEPTQPGQNPESGDQGPRRNSEEVLGPKNAERLEALGADGAAAAAAATATAPPEAGTGDRTAGGQSGPRSTDSSDDDGGWGFGEVIGQATGTSGDGGTSWLLPLFLAAVVIGSAAFLWRKIRVQ